MGGKSESPVLLYHSLVSFTLAINPCIRRDLFICKMNMITSTSVGVKIIKMTPCV